MAKPFLDEELWSVIEPLLPPPKPRRFKYPCRKPLDRRKVLTGILFVLKTGIPLAIKLTGGNRHDVTQLLPLVDSIPPIAGKVGHPIRRPKELFADRAYDSAPHVCPYPYPLSYGRPRVVDSFVR